MKRRVKITVLIVSYNDLPFIELNLHSLKALTTNEYEVLICDNGSSSRHAAGLRKLVAKHAETRLFRRDTAERGNVAHANGLNLLTAKVKTPYLCILDSDATWLMKDWDGILMRKMKGKVKLIGTQAPKGTKKFQDFPLMFAILFDTAAFRKCAIDFSPADAFSGQDTGYEMKSKYLRQGYSGRIIEMFNTRTFKKGPFYDLTCAEYYLKGYTHIFASHFGRGSSLGAAKYVRGFFGKIPGLNGLLRRACGLRERRLWIRRCRSLIDEQ